MRSVVCCTTVVLSVRRGEGDVNTEAGNHDLYDLAVKTLGTSGLDGFLLLHSIFHHFFTFSLHFFLLMRKSNGISAYAFN